MKLVGSVGTIWGLGFGLMKAVQAPLEKRLDEQREDIKVRTRLAAVS